MPRETMQQVLRSPVEWKARSEALLWASGMLKMVSPSCLQPKVRCKKQKHFYRDYVNWQYRLPTILILQMIGLIWMQKPSNCRQRLTG